MRRLGVFALLAAFVAAVPAAAQAAQIAQRSEAIGGPGTPKHANLFTRDGLPSSCADPGTASSPIITSDQFESANRLRGTRRRDVIAARGGNDVLRGLSGNDLLCGGSGKDTLRGGAGKDQLRGDSGSDLLRGDAGTTRCSAVRRGTDSSGVRAGTDSSGGPAGISCAVVPVATQSASNPQIIPVRPSASPDLAFGSAKARAVDVGLLQRLSNASSLKAAP